MHVFEKQKLIVIKANQNIDIVDLMNQMRGVLSDAENCQATFEGYGSFLSNNFTGLIDIIDQTETEIVEVEKFSTLEGNGLRYGESKIGIKSYNLKENFKISNQLSRFDFLITFDRGVDDLTVTKSFPIYLKFGPEKTVVECSLGRIKTATKLWSEKDSTLYSLGPVSINTPEVYASLNINKGIKFLKTDMSCGQKEKKDNGLISYSRQSSDLVICLDGKWYSLLKKRGISP